MGGAVVLASILFPLEGLAFLERVASIFDPQTMGLQTRLAMWGGTLRMIFDHLWIGVGAGNFTFAYVPYRVAVHYDRPAMRIEHPHNEYLAIWSELGTIGLLLLLWLIVRILRLGWQLAERSERDKGVIAGVLGGLAASAFYANFFYVFHVPASAVNVAILLGILEGMDREEKGEVKGLSLGRPIVLAMVLVISLFTFQYSLRPLMGDVYAQLAEREVAVGKIEAGLTHLERALRWHPQNFVARYRRAVLYLQTQRFPEAIQEAKATLDIHPNLQLAYGLMATAYVGLRDTATAKSLYQEALAINPYYTHALNNLGVIFLEEGKVTEAETLLKQAIALDTREDDTYANLGTLYRRVGRYGEAVAMYRQAATRHGKWSSYVWYSAVLHHLNGKEKNAAYAALARAIYLDEKWRGRAVNEPAFAEWRRKEARVRILLNLE
jgi:tetratricopeptide (TPR) repeat protein